MSKKIPKKLLAIIGVIAAITLVVVAIVLTNLAKYESATPSSEGAYLFVHFSGDEKSQESIHFSFSKDGYNFTPLNSNNPIITQELGSKSVRDPYIFKAKDGSYYIIGADTTADSKESYSFVTWHSSDLINWQDETILDIRSFGGEFEKNWCARSPQAIFDESVGMYMIYWTGASKNDKTTKIYYSYTYNFKSLSQQPAVLFEAKKDISDPEIYYDDLIGKYYLFYKNGNGSDFAYVTSKSLTSGYDSKPVSLLHAKGESGGCQIYKIVNQPNYVVMIDEYEKGKLVLEQTRDFKSFKMVKKKDYSFNMYPRQGNVIRISDDEYNRLSTAYGGFDNN